MNIENILPFIFLGVCAAGICTIGYLLKRENSRLFTEKYKQLRSLYGAPLKEFSFLSGWIGRRFHCVQFKGVLKLSVYADKLLVSVWGDCLSIPYEQGRIHTAQKWIFNYLVIEDISVPAQLVKFPCIEGDLPQKFPMFIHLSKRKIDCIMSFVRDAQPDRSGSN